MTALVSVIVPCTGELDATRACIAALVRHTRTPWELIAVADCRERTTAAYLAGVADAAPLRVEVLDRADAPGIAAAWNRGLDAARGAYLALLAPGAEVTDAWLDQLLALAESGPALGPVAPMSDAAGPPQHAGPAPADPDARARFAARWRAEHRGRWASVESLAGPCVLVARPLLDRIGPPDAGLEPRAALADLAARARRAGATPAVACDLIVFGGPGRPEPAPVAPTRIVRLAAADFARRVGNPDTARALHGYTPPADTHAVLALLSHARPRRVLEVGTALGHMTANLAEWTDDDARIVSIGLVRGLAGGAAEQDYEVPDRAAFGQFAGHFGKAHKVELIEADTRDVDFARLAPLDFAFIDGGHDFEAVTHDSRAAYAALAPGGWLAWHDFDSPVPWVRVRAAIEQLGLAEPVSHVAGTQVAFLRKAGPGPDPLADAPGAAGPLRLAWEGDVRGLHSLALVNRALTRALVARGHDLGIDPGPPAPADGPMPPDPALEARLGRAPAGGPPQFHVSHRWPPRLEPPPAGRWVFLQPWEFGRLPRAWLPALARADEVWAYSGAVRDVYLDAGLDPDRVHVVPLGVDPMVFRPGREPYPLPAGPSFRFLFVGGTIWRKGIDLLLAAFARAFAPGDDVGLVIKDMGTRSFYRGQDAAGAIAALRARGYAVTHLDQPLTAPRMAGLYAACDCLVLPYRGEGFALPVAEAMACGIPAVVTGAGPVRDYAGAATAYLVPARRVELPHSRVGDLETAGRPWVWEPDPEALVAQLRRAASDRAGTRARGAAATAWVRGRLTWAHAAAAAEARLRVLAARSDPAPGRRPHAAAAAARRATVSLTMIVRDEEANLPACLESTRDLFDEIVIVDTGSTDRTPEIARAFGARVFDFAWVDDFAAARNAALARARGDYAFWLDADDVLDPPQRETLRGLLAGLSPDAAAAYVVRCACDPDASGGGGQTVVDHVRLFPVREEVRWTYAVHEQILPALRQAGVPVRWTDLVVRHTGYADPALRRRKLARDEAILAAELAERPEDPFVLFNLGGIALERQDWHAALRYLRASLAGSAPADSITRKLYAQVARAHQALGESEAALAACAAGRAVDPDDAELLFREAMLRRHAGDAAGAEACWNRVLTLRPPERFSSVDVGIYGHLTRRNLALLAEERGDRAAALALWAAVAAECPADPAAAAARVRLGGPPAEARP